MEINQLQKLLNSIVNERSEFMVLLGKDRYENVVSEIREVLIRNGLDEIKSSHLINHLGRIFQLERTRL